MKKTCIFLTVSGILAAVLLLPGCQNETEPTVDILQETITLQQGDTLTLNITGTTADISWTSSAPDIAEIDQNGTVTANSVGEAVIKASISAQPSVFDECLITVTAAPAAIGDFYYSDGTWSSRLDENKTPVGIIFWTGDPTAHDPTLKKDHPECVHGLVVALTEAEPSAWQPKYYIHKNTVSSWVEANHPELLPILTNMDGTDPDYLNKTVGYNNTKAMELFNAAPENNRWTVNAVEALQQFKEGVSAPDASSGWYLPSTKELSLLCSGEIEFNIAEIGTYMTEMKETINQSIQTVPDADPLTNAGYWSCNETSDNAAFYIAFSMGTVIEFDKDADSNIRAILAF